MHVSFQEICRFPSSLSHPLKNSFPVCEYQRNECLNIFQNRFPEAASSPGAKNIPFCWINGISSSTISSEDVFQHPHHWYGRPLGKAVVVHVQWNCWRGWPYNTRKLSNQSHKKRFIIRLSFSFVSFFPSSYLSLSPPHHQNESICYCHGHLLRTSYVEKRSHKKYLGLWFSSWKWAKRVLNKYKNPLNSILFIFLFSSLREIKIVSTPF